MINGKKSGLYEELKERFSKLELQTDFSFARHTTIGCGNHASVAAFPKNCEEAVRLIAFLEEAGVPYIFLGAGANVLPSDRFFHGVVIKFSKINFLTTQGNTVFVGAGVTGGALLRFAMQRGLSGAEPLTMIPTTVGGGIAMNAGVRERHFCDLVQSVTAIDRGKKVELSVGECGFGEKQSVFQSKIAVLGATLQLTPSDRKTISAERLIFANRRKGLPKGRSMGCAFVNPAGASAGALIDGCGLKGFAVGKEIVSHLHATCIINAGDRSADVSAVIDRVRDRVFQKTGVLLREEIKRLPPF